MKNEINIPDGTEEIVIRKGEAAPVIMPEKFNFVGKIDSPSKYLKHRKNVEDFNQWQTVAPSISHIEFNKILRTITLYVDANDKFSSVIKGTLVDNPELEQFYINSESKKWTREEIVKLLRFNKRFFPNVEEYTKLLDAFKKLEIKSASEIRATSDTRGNKDNVMTKAVDSSKVPTDFILRIPIFKDEPPLTFRVEIALDTTDGGARFWFESPELIDLVDKEVNLIFQTEAEKMEGFLILFE